MANEEHLTILKKGWWVWNQWRLDNRGIVPDLADADLEWADLQNTMLGKANLVDAHLSNANLSGATLWMANLQDAEFYRAILCKAELREARIIETFFGGGSKKCRFFSFGFEWGAFPDGKSE